MADRNVDVALQYCSEVSAADWIVQAQIPWEQLVNFGPPDFPAYARLRFIPDPTKPGQAEADAYVAEGHLSGMQQTRLALEHLRRFTGTPEDCYFCVWEGYGDLYVTPWALSVPMVTIPHRRYFLFRGSLADLASWEETSPASETSHPASPGRPITAGVLPATSTHIGLESEPSKQRSTHCSMPRSSTSSRLDQASPNPPTTNAK